MAWGVLEDHKMAKVPGTVALDDGNAASEGTRAAIATLKRQGEVVLAPQPSNSPNDPLNWPMWQKNTIITILSLGSGVTVGMTVMLTPAFHVLTETYNISFSTASTFVFGTLVLATGIGTFFSSAAATIWGKRPVFLVSTLILLICCVWGFLARSFVSLAAMRMVEGLASAPLEMLVTSTVGDLFFVHQRGSKMAVWGFMYLCGISMSQLFGGFIVQRMGVKWTFAFCGLALSLILSAMYFFVPETVYNQPEQESVELKRIVLSTLDRKDRLVMVEVMEVADGEPLEPKLPYRASLQIFNGRSSSQGFWKTVFRPFDLVFYPAVIYSTFVYGAFHTWLIVFTFLQATILTGPAYHLQPSQVGLTNLPSFIVGLLAIMFAGWFADWLARSISRRNRGIYEPEFRLLLMTPAVIFSTIGFVGFGFSVEQHAPLWQVLLFSTLYHIAIPFASAASHTYVVDCHQENVNQAFVVINFVKTLLTFLASLYVNEWLEKVGAKKIFVTLAIINLAVSMLTTPMYVYGKRFRGFVARREILNARIFR